MVTFTDRDDRRSAHLHNRAIQNANAVRERRATLENPDWLMSRPADWYTELDTQGEPSNWRAAKNVLQHRPAVTTDMNEQRNMFQMLANQAKGGDRGARLIDTRGLPAGARRTGRTMFQDPSRAQGFLGDVGSLFTGNKAAVYADEYNPFPKAGFGKDWYRDQFPIASGLGSFMEAAENFIPGATWAKQFLPKSKRLPLERDLSWVPEGVGEYDKIPLVADAYRNAGVSSIIIGDENYGEGSSREHAAMEPRFVGVKAVLVKSFARIHETNLKKQGVLALIFKANSDYNKIQEDDTFDFLDLNQFSPGKLLTLKISHSDGSTDEILCKHTYNETQIEWFKAGSALNLISSQH